MTLNDKMRAGGGILRDIFTILLEYITPGKTTKDIETLLSKLLKQFKVESGTLGFNGFPSVVCISVNEEILNGVPSNRILSIGDLVSVDLLIKYNGVYLDKAITMSLGNARYDQHYIINAANQCLDAVITLVKPNMTNYDIGEIIFNTAYSLGVKTIKGFGGHGIGLSRHTKPFIPNSKIVKEVINIKSGMFFTAEPIVCYNSPLYEQKGVTVIGDPISAHVEETLLMTDTGIEVMTR